MTIRNGRPVRVRTIGDDLPAAVSCVSLTLCYVAGGQVIGPAFVLTLRDGRTSARRTTAGQLTGIACAGTRCMAVGQLLIGDAFAGILVPVSGGRLSVVIDDLRVAGYDGVASRGPFDGFAAVGAGQRTGSELTTG